MSSTSKHPKGLLFLAFTEFWERFGYYLMIGIFFLYMTTDTKDGGFGWENAKAADVFGTFIACAYLTPFVGGLLADMTMVATGALVEVEPSDNWTVTERSVEVGVGKMLL